jgi:hypothetical protein
MNFENEKIIVCLTSDISLYWVHQLEFNKETCISENDFLIYKSKNCYYLYYQKDFNSLYHYLIQLVEKNYVHIIITDFNQVDYVIEHLDNKKINNLDYSIVNHMAETMYDNEPRNIKNLKNIKYYFSCGDLLDKQTNQISQFQLEQKDKFIIDYKYSLIYFYIKLGFNFFERDNFEFDNTFRKDKLFVYSKSVPGSEREMLLNEIIKSDRVYNKVFNENDKFWNNINYNKYHSSFYVDYMSCKLNLITETQPPSFNIESGLSKFISEKTLKALMVSTPSYLLCQKETYYNLKGYGFYFLNEEFGEYNLDNYNKFVTFINECNDFVFNQFFQRTFKKSKLNKIKLEEYIYSDKTKEINLILNKTI